MMMYDTFDIIFAVVFMLMLGIFVYIFISGIHTWSKNNHSPRLTVDALITGKRMDVSSHTNAGDGMGMNGVGGMTTYFVTFQVESGDRMELLVSGQEYGQLAQGDKGKLLFQGTRYLGFERTMEQ